MNKGKIRATWERNRVQIITIGLALGGVAAVVLAYKEGVRTSVNHDESQKNELKKKIDRLEDEHSYENHMLWNSIQYIYGFMTHFDPSEKDLKEIVNASGLAPDVAAAVDKLVVRYSDAVAVDPAE